MMNSKQLRQAIKTGDAKQVAEILRTSPKEKVVFYHGWTPLHVAAKCGNPDVASAILATGAAVNAVTDLWQTPFDIAMKHNHRQIANLLSKKGGHSAAKLSLHAAAAAGDLVAVKSHVAAGENIQEIFDGETPLCIALHHRHWPIASYLIKKNANVKLPQRWHTTPLHVAAASGAPIEIIAKLVKLGAEVDALDECERTPLCHAAEAGHTEIVQWLLDHGANVTHGHVGSSAPVYCALIRDHTELASLLIDRGGKCTLHQAIACNHLARARQLLNAGADVHKEEDLPYYNTPLAMAVWRDSAEMVTLLLEFGADPNRPDESHQAQHGMVGGDTALHEAVLKGSAKMVKLLLAHGADPDIPDASGTTPIELARLKDRSHLVHLMELHIDKKLSLVEDEAGVQPLYTVSKVAELLSVDDTFVLDLIKTRKITGLQLDEKTLRITAGSVQRYLAKMTLAATSHSR
ncbi:MAG TPA: ankyrin repeat domain-containing protein [Verrucomicrobiae bacterium]|nr:ankyrin repeat domain-containing protein [Verrucomicrobiae bacterium]